MSSEREKILGNLISNRVARLSSALSRGAAIRYRRESDVTLGEWRTLALLDQEPGLTLNLLARRAGLDKSQMSRAVRRLTERGYIDSELGTRRSKQLSLTTSGQEAVAGLMDSAYERDERLRSAVTDAEVLVFERVLAKMLRVAREMEEEEESLG